MGWGAVRRRGVGHRDRGLLMLVLVLVLEATPVAHPRRGRQHFVFSRSVTAHAILPGLSHAHLAPTRWSGAAAGGVGGPPKMVYRLQTEICR